MSQSELLNRLQMFYGELDAPLLLRAMIREEFSGQIALISSFGADAALMLALVAEVDKATPVLFLETQKHFPQTLDYARELSATLGLSNVRWLTPDARGLGTHEQLGLPPCGFYLWYGLPCPSCGMTTSWPHFLTRQNSEILDSQTS
ncbi:MAG: DUF2752 domain-containing protein, partial [Proteobacteria bacterium]|nr:DUF2752 domain-containing protein [Pseudomonadota bacterium]